MTLPHYVVGVDPGKLTGVSVYDTTERRLVSAFWADRETYEGWSWGFLANAQELGRSVLVACERFVIGPRTLRSARGDENWSLELIGVTRFLCSSYGAEFKLSDVATANRMAPDARLREVGWYQKGENFGHANDATRHVVVALAELGVPPPWVGGVVR